MQNKIHSAKKWERMYFSNNFIFNNAKFHSADFVVSLKDKGWNVSQSPVAPYRPLANLSPLPVFQPLHETTGSRLWGVIQESSHWHWALFFFSPKSWDGGCQWPGALSANSLELGRGITAEIKGTKLAESSSIASFSWHIIQFDLAMMVLILVTIISLWCRG